MIAFGVLTALVRDVAALAGRRRLVAAGALMLASTLAEGVGLMLLVPMLATLGIAGSGSFASWLGWLDLGPISLETALTAYVVLVAAAAWIVRSRAVMAAEVERAVSDGLRTRLHAAVLGMKWRAFVLERSGGFTQALSEGAGAAGLAVDQLLRLMVNGLQIPVVLAVALSLSPMLTVIVLVVGCVGALAARPLNRRTWRVAQAEQRAWEGLHADIADDMAGMRVIRSHSLEAIRHRRFIAQTTHLRETGLGYARAVNTERALTRVAAAAAATLVVMTAVHGLALPLADALALVVMFMRLLMVGMSLQDGYRTVLRMLPHYAALIQLVARCRAEAEADGTTTAETQPPPPPLTTGIRLEGVSFHHSGSGRPTLEDISLEIPALGITAVVGPSGAGKSTLADLLLGLLEPDQGRIRVDGAPLTAHSRRRWRQSVGYVPQDGFLFHDTIRANLTLVAPDASEPALWQALEQAAAADFVRALPLGLDTVVGDRGGRLSGGERQRLALARALVRRPVLLILDEATSALDAESERQVLATLDHLRRTMAVVVVAHRPSTVRGADTIILLEAGRVVATGAPEGMGESARAFLARLDFMIASY